MEKARLSIKIQDRYYSVDDIINIEYSKYVVKNALMEIPIDVKTCEGKIKDISSEMIIIDCSSKYNSKIEKIDIDEIHDIHLI